MIEVVAALLESPFVTFLLGLGAGATAVLAVVERSRGM